MTTLYIVDPEKDFMNEDGALPVPGAGDIKEALKELVVGAKEGVTSPIVIISMDWHDKDDPEFEKFPPHCIAGTPGAEIIPEVIMDDNLFITKQSINVWDNPITQYVFNQWNSITEAIVCGVATEHCVKAAVMGMQEHNIQCYVVKDAIKGIDPEEAEKAIQEMKEAGAVFISLEDALVKMKAY